jgi:MarR family transcriptional repressor of emrRAB
LHLTTDGEAFIQKVLPPQHKCLHFLWSTLDADEQKQLEILTRKLLTRLDQMDVTATQFF